MPFIAPFSPSPPLLSFLPSPVFPSTSPPHSRDFPLNTSTLERTAHKPGHRNAVLYFFSLIDRSESGSRFASVFRRL